MPANNFNIPGLSKQEVIASRSKNGDNRLTSKKEYALIDAIKNLAKEPMVILLMAAAVIYLISGQSSDAIFLASAVILVAAISLYQDSRSRNALDKLKTYSQPHCKVIRDGQTTEIKSEEIVIGDYLIIEEGTSVTADGSIVHSNDFSVNESILTGESFVVYKDKDSTDHEVFQGTTVASGLAIAVVTAIGNGTKLGKIGKSLEDIKEEKTPLEIQINNFIKKMVVAGAAVFCIVWGINYFNSLDVLDSLLKALTLAMSILPEEIPVAFATFMALGAWRMMQMGVVVKQMKTVETLGSATVICTDKTGTITENKMSLARLYLLASDKIAAPDQDLNDAEKALIRMGMWASEPIPFDPMEVALHHGYAETTFSDERPDYKMVHEYPLGGKPPMMTHIFENKSGIRIIAAKGAPEALIAVSELEAFEKEKITMAVNSLASQGYRVLAVGQSDYTGSQFPDQQQKFKFKFIGMLAFYDPPKQHIEQVLKDFYQAGIAVKIITGDNAATTTAIARQIGFKGYEKSISGDELMKMPEKELQRTVMQMNIFSRMFPDAKLKIINALKSNNEIVAMTGDGVNDGPALKAAHIGIAMGKRGTEIARQAASLILLEDDLAKMVTAIAMGRRIYTNLKKAIQYIISIHIPIILTVFIPLALGWVYPNIFSPIHIIFLELVMGPTCSIIYEHEPIEQNTMLQKPRPFSTTFFSSKELTTSILQGSMITAGTLFIYQFAVEHGYSEGLTRSMVFTCLIAANVLLTLVNRSFYYSLLTTINYKNNLVFLIIMITILISGAILYIKPLTVFFGFQSLSLIQLSLSIGIGFLSVIWYEFVKWKKRLQSVT
ncbi:haloacid dehalogenase [Pedobacter ginsengisoli]|uniref:Haloacid dehalogenase n=1 Tax=Pedobacter ginsengisoli TaxID=363852 RepID=A0A2D1U221_9SPHI|nr:cation-translocating P-type ATPase [Pedobacter ginsengisoli]ATP55564.1 haloacid dehalogenase [Pedobacter ginsengisoli]